MAELAFFGSDLLSLVVILTFHYRYSTVVPVMTKCVSRNDQRGQVSSRKSVFSHNQQSIINRRQTFDVDRYNAFNSAAVEQSTTKTRIIHDSVQPLRKNREELIARWNVAFYRRTCSSVQIYTYIHPQSASDSEKHGDSFPTICCLTHMYSYTRK